VRVDELSVGQIVFDEKRRNLFGIDGQLAEKEIDFGTGNHNDEKEEKLARFADERKCVLIIKRALLHPVE
jgi:hypothetical protein